MKSAISEYEECLINDSKCKSESYMAVCALQPRLRGGRVASVQCESNVRYLGIRTC